MKDGNRIIDASVKHGYRIIRDTGGSLIRVPSNTVGVFYGSTVLDGVVQPHLHRALHGASTVRPRVASFPGKNEATRSPRAQTARITINRQGGELLIDIM